MFLSDLHLLKTSPANLPILNMTKDHDKNFKYKIEFTMYLHAENAFASTQNTS